MQCIAHQGIGIPQVAVDADFDADAVAVAQTALYGTDHVPNGLGLAEQVRPDLLLVRPWLWAPAVDIDAVHERADQLGRVGQRPTAACGQLAHQCATHLYRPFLGRDSAGAIVGCESKSAALLAMGTKIRVARMLAAAEFRGEDHGRGRDMGIVACRERTEG